MVTEYFVAKYGSDNYSNAQATNRSTPKLTIAAGLACLKSGDMLTIIGPGDWDEGINGFMPGSIPSGPAESAPTVVRADGDVTLSGQSADQLGVVCIYGKAYIELRDLTLDGRNGVGSCLVIGNGNITGMQGCHHVRMTRGSLINGAAAGYTESGELSNNNITLESIFVANCGKKAWALYGWQGHGVYVKSPNFLIHGSEIVGSQDYGVHMYLPAGIGIDNSSVIDCNIHNNGAGVLMSSGVGQEVGGCWIHDNRRVNVPPGQGSTIDSGIGMYVGSVNPHVRECTITGQVNGPAIWNRYSDGALINNNHFEGNNPDDVINGSYQGIDGWATNYTIRDNTSGPIPAPLPPPPLVTVTNFPVPQPPPPVIIAPPPSVPVQQPIIVQIPGTIQQPPVVLAPALAAPVPIPVQIPIAPPPPPLPIATLPTPAGASNVETQPMAPAPSAAGNAVDVISATGQPPTFDLMSQMQTLAAQPVTIPAGAVILAATVLLWLANPKGRK